MVARRPFPTKGQNLPARGRADFTRTSLEFAAARTAAPFVVVNISLA